MAESVDESLPFLRALGDPDRLRIVRLLRNGPKTVSDICQALNSPMANVSHHLGMLKDAGIVSATKRGRFVFHQLNHLVERQLTGAQALDFGCCRIEFPDQASRQRTASASDVEQALHILNEVLGKASTRSDVASPMSEGVSSAPADSSSPAAAAAGRRIAIENATFESPATPFFDTAVTAWHKEGDPVGTGVFRNFPDNTPLPGSRFIQNAASDQLATIGARKGLGLFQQIEGERYASGTAYTLTACMGVSSVQPPVVDRGLVPSLRLSLTYLDDAGTRHEIAGRSVAVPSLAQDSARLTEVSISALIPPNSPATGRSIGVLVSTLDNTPSHVGHFILGSVHLIARDAE